ncbi:hypothetical protein NDU88_003015, partial [Pleurodeles waltl]
SLEGVAWGQRAPDWSSDSAVWFISAAGAVLSLGSEEEMVKSELAAPRDSTWQAQRVLLSAIAATRVECKTRQNQLPAGETAGN